MAITHDDAVGVWQRVGEAGACERPDPRIRLDVASPDVADLFKLDVFIHRLQVYHPAEHPDEPTSLDYLGTLCGMRVYVDKTVTPGTLRATYRLPRRRTDTVLDLAWGADP